MRDSQYFVESSTIQAEYEEYSAEYCQSHKHCYGSE